MDVSANHCGIRIDKAHPYDTGEWKCHVTEVPGGSTLYSAVDLYVSNHSQVYISEPDMWEDSSQAWTNIQKFALKNLILLKMMVHVVWFIRDGL